MLSMQWQDVKYIQDSLPQKITYLIYLQRIESLDLQQTSDW